MSPRIAVIATLMALMARRARRRRGIPLEAARGFSRARGPGGQPDERGEGRARCNPVCRSAAVDHRRTFLPELSFARRARSRMACRVRAAPRARRCRSTRPRCSMSPTTRRSAGAMPNLRTLEQQMRGPLFNEHPRELGLAGPRARARTRTGGRSRRWRAGSRRRFPASRRP